MNWILDSIAAFLISLIIAGIVIPQILLIAFRNKLFDVPDARKIHRATVPRLGGIAFMPSIVLSLCLVVGFEALMASGPLLVSTLLSSHWNVLLLTTCFGLCALMMMYLVGMADDLVGVQYRAKFVAQLLAAALLAVGGARIMSFFGFMGLTTLPMWFSVTISVILIVYITNAINLIDGIDGLASGLSAIAMAFYGIAFMSLNYGWLAIISFAGLGTLVPFFYYNVFGNPEKQKKIFMGDTGALTIGILLSYLAMMFTRVHDDHLFSANVLVVAFSPLALPCLDVLRVFVHRIVRGHSPFMPDRVHIHHKLLALGLPTRLAMIIILITSVVFITFNILLSHVASVLVVLIADIVVWAVVNLLLTKAIRRRQRKLNNNLGYD